MTPLMCAKAAAAAYDRVTITAHDVEVYVQTTGGAIIVAFRGTEANGWGLLWDGSRDARAAPWWDKHLGVCHAGFRWGVHFIWPKLEPILQDAKRDYLRIYFAGHSLGGALAIGAAVYCWALVKPPAGLVTLGAPALGGRRVGRALRAFPVRRFVSGADVVPVVPPWFPHHVPAIRLGERVGWFKDHRVALYLERIAGWPGATEPF